MLTAGSRLRFPLPHWLGVGFALMSTVITVGWPTAAAVEPGVLSANLSRIPAGYVAPTDRVAAVFEVYPPGSTGSLVYTTDNRSTSTSLAATKAGTKGITGAKIELL